MPKGEPKVLGRLTIARLRRVTKDEFEVVHGYKPVEDPLRAAIDRKTFRLITPYWAAFVRQGSPFLAKDAPRLVPANQEILDKAVSILTKPFGSMVHDLRPGGENELVGAHGERLSRRIVELVQDVFGVEGWFSITGIEHPAIHWEAPWAAGFIMTKERA